MREAVLSGGGAQPQSLELRLRWFGELVAPCGVFLPVKCLQSSTAFPPSTALLCGYRGAVVGQRETGPAVGFGKIIFHIRTLVFLFFSANRSLIKDGFTNCASWSLRVFTEVLWGEPPLIWGAT